MKKIGSSHFPRNAPELEPQLDYSEKSDQNINVCDLDAAPSISF